jgi:hypothetical protein
MMIGIVIAILACLVVAAAAGARPGARRLLLGWYVHEVARAEVAAAPDQAIVTYPLA